MWLGKINDTKKYKIKTNIIIIIIIIICIRTIHVHIIIISYCLIVPHMIKSLSTVVVCLIWMIIHSSELLYCYSRSKWIKTVILELNNGIDEHIMETKNMGSDTVEPLIKDPPRKGQPLFKRQSPYLLKCTCTCNTFSASKNRTSSLQGTKWLVPMCPLYLEVSPLYHHHCTTTIVPPPPLYLHCTTRSTL